MKPIVILVIITLVCAKKPGHTKEKVEHIKHVEKHPPAPEVDLTDNSINKTETPSKNATVIKVKIVPPKKKEKKLRLLSPTQIQGWANEISEKLYDIEERVVRRQVLQNGFKDVKLDVRDGATIVENMARALEDLLKRRTAAAQSIMRAAEELSQKEEQPPPEYFFDHSFSINERKMWVPPESEWELPLDCRNYQKVNLTKSRHFDARVNTEISSVYVSAEVFDCDPRVLPHIYWSENLINIFKKNYAEDASLEFQYFCSAKGFLRHYPAAQWQDMYKVDLDANNIYDCRLRPWYVSASGAPRDVLILIDASGSMDNSSNAVVAEQFTKAMLNALTDDDQVNVLRFNVTVKAPIACFHDRLVPANHVNCAAMMAAMDGYVVKNTTWMDQVLIHAVRMLQKQYAAEERPTSCQQAIVLLTDSLYDNYTELMATLDPDGKIRLFTLWLHDIYGLRDNTRALGSAVSCARDGYFAELITDADATEQVMRVLRVLERPLVAQRGERPAVFSDVYAHVEDPRRAEFYWKQKENEEQLYRYTKLRRNKAQLLDPTQMYNDYMHQYHLTKHGQYYEGEDVNYRLQISVAVPVFEHTTFENITITLDEEMQRRSTRTYPVNRLLGVAGVDIPLDHLKKIFPYFKLGGGGSLMLIDHRGKIILHDNTKPVFDGDILKPGYRTVDILELEQPGITMKPREFPDEWMQFRNRMILNDTKGSTTMFAQYTFDDGMRTILQHREYHWKRVLHHYTALVSLPPHSRRHPKTTGGFTQELANKAQDALFGTDFDVHPDWLYCEHLEPYFDVKYLEVLHFIRRRMDEPDFKMKKLKHVVTPLTPALLEKTYICNEELITKFCLEAIATRQWAIEHEDEDAGRTCGNCQLGSNTAFFTGESGLTRWQQYHATSPHADPPEGSVWARGPAEPWYVRAAAARGALVVHAPARPVRRRRRTQDQAPQMDVRTKWLTAARTLDSPSGNDIVGVAGFHFYPEHLDDLLQVITNFHCGEVDESKCEPRCDGEDWSCILVDEGGWVVAGAESSDEEPTRKHLANTYPMVMYALLNAHVFNLTWVHDYQSICFPDVDNTAALTLPSLLKSLWRTLDMVISITWQLITYIIITSGGLVTADTEAEKEKRRRRLYKDYQREKYETLFDDRVLVNRTTFAACDRSRPHYILQRTPKAMANLKKPPNPCAWPLVAAEVPKTNLILMAIFNLCPMTSESRPMSDPLINQMVAIDEEWKNEIPESQLACSRNRKPFPARLPPEPCFPHNYTFEEGYRQCGPWLPDAVQEED